MSIRSYIRHVIRRATRHVLAWGVNSALFWAVTAIFFGGIIHLTVIMSLPYLSHHDAWHRLVPLTPTNRLVPLNASPTNQMPLPYMTTDMRYAVCRYDLSQGDLLIQADLLDDYWSVAIYTRYGQNFYMINGRDVRRSQVELLLSTNLKSRGTGLSQNQQKEQDNGDGLIKVGAADKQGIVLIRAPLLGEAFAERAEKGLRNASCNLQQSTETAAAIQ